MIHVSITIVIMIHVSICVVLYLLAHLPLAKIGTALDPRVSLDTGGLEELKSQTIPMSYPHHDPYWDTLLLDYVRSAGNDNLLAHLGVTPDA